MALFAKIGPDNIVISVEVIDDNELIKRLKDRGHDNKFIEKRMELAAAQRSKINDFDYVVNNKDINISKKIDNINLIEQLSDDVLKVLAVAGMKYYSELREEFE